MERHQHWGHVYQTKPADTVSWYQPSAERSMDIMLRLVPDREATIIDAGAGASIFVDNLLEAGYGNITLVDVSGEALQITRHRLGDAANRVTFIAADLLDVDVLPAEAFDVWHDRAVFHFLTAPDDRARYVGQVRRAMRPGGLVVVATFADDGPTRCSGLDVMRYSAASLHEAFGPGFALVEHHRDMHTTPGGAPQAFTFAVFRFERGH